MPNTLMGLVKQIHTLVSKAESAGVVIDDGNVVDLIADNINAPLLTIREALMIAYPSNRFPKATSIQHFRP